MMETQLEAASAGSRVEPVKRPVMRTPDGRELPAGRVKGTPNKVTRTIREAVEMAARDCHPKGLAGWLVERANGSLGDRQIFAAMVAKALPLQVNANVSGGITISMPWLGQRGVAGATVAQLDTARAQVIDATDILPVERRINDASDQPQPAPAVQAGALEQAAARPPTPLEAGAGGVAGEGAPTPLPTISKPAP